MITNKLFTEIFRPWFDAYQSPPSTKGQVDVYVSVFNENGYSIDELRECATKVLRTRTNPFFPKVPEVIEFMMRNKNETPEAAWSLVARFIRLNPPNTPYHFEDPRTATIVSEFGGLYQVRLAHDARARFIARYKELLNVF